MDKYYFCDLLKKYYLCFDPSSKNNKWYFMDLLASQWSLANYPSYIHVKTEGKLLIDVPYAINGEEIEGWLQRKEVKELLDRIEGGYISDLANDPQATFDDTAKDAIEKLKNLLKENNEELPLLECGCMWACDYFKKKGRIEEFIPDTPPRTFEIKQIIDEIDKCAKIRHYCCLSGLEAYVKGVLDKKFGDWE